jgi:hypothetical protein
MSDVPKDVANHFLNHAFGWAPFVGDLMDFRKTYLNLDRNIAQLQRDNGRWVRRRYRFSQIESMSEPNFWPARTGPLVYPIPHDFVLAKRGGKWGRTTSWETNVSDTWFSGSFKYFVPSLVDNGESRDLKRVLNVARQFGLRLSPSVVWNLTPWSWLADWFGNLGDIVDNVTAQSQDNLTTKYAYIMRHSRRIYSNDSVVYLRGGDAHGYWTRSVESKTRIEASPFGFGLSGGVNSTYRVAILAALGLTRRG